MGYEIDFLAVGDESKSGDAIAIRYGNLHGRRDEHTVIVIDGGFSDDGQRLVEHIQTHYQTNQVDLVISTHPDQDHINGLSTVLKQLQVSRLWIHKPWEHPNLKSRFRDGRVTDNSIGERLKVNLEAAFELEKLAQSKLVMVEEPFAGTRCGEMLVLGPSRPYYDELLPQFYGMPLAALAASVQATSNCLSALRGKSSTFINWGTDQIDDEDTTSAKNNSSVICQLSIEGRRLLFTGDAGITALNHAANAIDYSQLTGTLAFIQIPHHGSRRNVGPSVLNRLIGEPLPQGQSRSIFAVASAAVNGAPKHPHLATLNAFTHRGVRCFATQGTTACLSSNAPARSGWGPVEIEPFHYLLPKEAA